MTPELYRDGHSKALLLFKRGTKNLHCLMIAPPVRVVKLEKVEERHFTPLLFRGELYPVRRALRRFKSAGRSLGITDGAKAIIRELQSTGDTA